MGEKASILDVKGLQKYFGGLKAVDGIDLKIEREGLISIIGPNGAGKTTLFNLISGILKPTGGKVYLYERDVTGWPPYRLSKMGLGRSFQITNIFPLLTVLENVRLATQAAGGDNFRFWLHYKSLKDYQEKALEILRLVKMEGKAQILARSLPHGDKRKLEIAIALAGAPTILLLDEPTAGISTEEIPEIVELIRCIRDEQEITILLVEHRMAVVTSISDEITVLNRGRILARGTPAAIMANEDVQKAYLGGGTQ